MGPNLYLIVIVCVSPAIGQARTDGSLSLRGVRNGLHEPIPVITPPLPTARYTPVKEGANLPTGNNASSIIASEETPALSRLGSGASHAPLTESKMQMFGTQLSGHDGPVGPKQAPCLSSEPPFGHNGPRGPKQGSLHPPQ